MHFRLRMLEFKGEYAKNCIVIFFVPFFYFEEVGGGHGSTTPWPPALKIYSVLNGSELQLFSQAAFLAARAFCSQSLPSTKRETMKQTT